MKVILVGSSKIQGRMTSNQTVNMENYQGILFKMVIIISYVIKLDIELKIHDNNSIYVRREGFKVFTELSPHTC